METVEIPREICEYIQTQAQQEEKERVIEAVREWLNDNIYEQDFECRNGYYDMCVTAYETEEKFWNAFDEFIKTL